MNIAYCTRGHNIPIVLIVSFFFLFATLDTRFQITILQVYDDYYVNVRIYLMPLFCLHPRHRLYLNLVM